MQFTKFGKNTFWYKFIQGTFFVDFIFILLLALTNMSQKLSGGVGVYFLIIFVIFIVINFIFLIKSYVEFINLGYAINEHSFVFQKGFLTKTQTTIPFIRITNVAFTQNILHQIFQVGSLLIDQEDSHEVIPDIDKINSQKIIDLVSSKAPIQMIGLK